jgi:hypothetical protein
MTLNRRQFLAAGSAFTAWAASPRVLAQWQPSRRYPDPLIKILDPAFARYRVSNAKVEQIASGLRWAEGPVWFGDGRYLLWSDIPNIQSANARGLRVGERSAVRFRVMAGYESVGGILPAGLFCEPVPNALEEGRWVFLA